MSLRYPLFTYFLVALIHLSSFAQSDSSFLTRAIGKLSQQPAAEKVYLHLDKPGGYFYGDTIWYKAYTVIGQHHQLSALSGVLYVELINSHDSVVNRQTLRLVSGIAWGNIPISRKLSQGSYRIRAYTNWMRNAPDYFYDQKVRIGGIVPVFSNHTVKNPDVQFFPEGGQLVNGVRSRVAVKAIGINGLGVDFTGTIEDTDGNLVAEFATRHLGMGVFPLIPQAGKAYKAKITIPGDAPFVVDLPNAVEEGFTLSLNNSQKDSIYIKVAINDKVLTGGKSSIFSIVAQNNGKVYYTSQGKLESLVYSARVEKSRFPTGITQFTLFSQNGEPLAERIAFIQSADTLKLNIKSANENFSTRQKVKIDLNTSDKDNKPATGSFSVAVINESRAGANANEESTILNNLLLTSDLKGYIEQPNYYFINSSDERKADLDILMLTQGYRRYEWKKVLNQPIPPVTYLPEYSLEIEGTLKTPSGNPVPNGKITLLATREKFISDTTTDINGNFVFKDIDLPDTAKIVLRARKEHNGSNVAIYVKQAAYQTVTGVKKTNDDIAVRLTPEMIKNIEDYHAQQKRDTFNKVRELTGVTITGKSFAKPDEYNGYGTVLERSLNMKALNNYISIDEAIGELVPKHENAAQIVVVDGLELYSKNVLSTYSPSEIQSVRLIDGGGYDAVHGGRKPEYIVISTKRYAGTDTTVLKGVTITSKKINKAPDLSSSSNLRGGGNADQVIMGEKVSGCVTLSDCLQGKVFGVSFGADGTPRNQRDGKPMSVIIDGLILDGDNLNNMNANNIYSIEVLRSAVSRSIYGSSIQVGGALIITTKRTSDPSYVTSIRPAGLITYPFKGYAWAKSFYSPKYTHPKTDAEPLDLRSTIFWKPNIITDKNGNASFEYFDNDTKGTYRVVVEGIDDNGNLGRQIFRYKVEK